MTLHAITQYLAYKWQAMGRHGIHSPFVYSFIEDVIQDRKRIFTGQQIHPAFLWLGDKYGRLASRIVSYYSFKDLLIIPGDQPEITGRYNFLVFQADDPNRWVSDFDKKAHLLQTDSVILIPDIHQTLCHTTSWQLLCNHPKVLMSIDMYGVGLLFFKKEFREQQHFVLRYKG
jgi:hypothetical protein